MATKKKAPAKKSAPAKAAVKKSVPAKKAAVKRSAKPAGEYAALQAVVKDSEGKAINNAEIKSAVEKSGYQPGGDTTQLYALLKSWGYTTA